VSDPADNAYLREYHAALRLIFDSGKSDAIARALDVLGYMIVAKPGTCPKRWPMQRQGICPSWAQSLKPPNPPALRLVDGAKEAAP
jgi:hypothetical protein